MVVLNGVDAHIGRYVPKADLVFGLVASTPRSGTTYIRALLERCGVRVGHENVFKSSGGVNKPPDWLDVEVSGFAGLHPFTNEGPVVHQVRHPLKVVSSLVTLGLLGSSDPEAVADWYCMVVEANETAADFTYRVEDVDVDVLRYLLGVFDVDDSKAEEAFNTVPVGLNSRPRTDLTDVGPKVAELVERFGYEM